MTKKSIPVLKDTYKKPTAVSFNTKRGRASFITRAKVGKPIKVSFKTKGKK